MKLIHRFPGLPLLWIAKNSRGQFYLFRQINGSNRARLQINPLYADALALDRAKAERALSQCLL